ncbi:MAG: DJ-1 family glyoxalase III [bacterium]
MASKIMVPLAEGFEEIEAIVPIDVWRRAGFQVLSAGLKSGPVRASRQTIHVPDVLLDSILDHEFDLIFLPGGRPGTDHLIAHQKLGERLQQQAASGKWIAAICAAPLVLDRLGLLKDKKFSCHPQVKAECSHLPSEGRVIVDQKIVTASGPGAAMELALTVVQLLASSEKRNIICQGLVC